MAAKQAKSPTGSPADSPVPLESILCTEELNRRPARPPDYQTENRALAVLVKALADSPRTILQTLADTILEVFQADSAGLSLLTTHDGGKRFYWPAIAGAWQPHIGGGTPRDFGPCGDVLDRNAPMLFTHFERRYPYLRQATPAAKEALLIPFFVNGKAVGTIWAMAHDDRRRFDAEDLRQLESLGRFASAAYQAVELQRSKDSRLAALNLMEDAVHARQAADQLNVELRESEERNRTLTGQVKDYAIFRTDVQGRALTWNQGVERILGFDEADFIGQDIVEAIFTPEDVASGAAQQELDTAAAKGTAGNDRSMMRKNGERFYANGVTTALKNDSGELIGFTKVMRDMTEHKRADSLLQCQKQVLEMVVKGEALEHVLEFLARAMERQSQAGVVVAIHLMEADGYHFGHVAAPSLPASYAEATRGMDARLELGTCSSAVMSHTPTVVRDLAAQERWPAFSAEVVALGLRGCFTTPILSPDQKVLGTFAIYYREPRDPSPHDQQMVDLVTRTVAIAIERKQAEEEIRRSQRTLFDLVGRAPFGIYIVDSQFRIAQMNAASQAGAFRNVRPVIGRDFAEAMRILWPEPVAAQLIAVFRRTLETGAPYYSKDFTNQRDDVETVESYEWELHRVTLPDGDYGVVCYYFDSTTLRQAERTIIEQAEELAGESRRKDEFLAMLAHELRNPLAPILNSIGILQRSGPSQPVSRPVADLMERQVQHMARLIDDLLDVSRVSQGKIDIRRTPVDVASIVNQAIEAARPLLDRFRLNLTVTLPPKPIHVNVDPARMTQVIDNLLNNAAKFTPKDGHVRVTVERDGGQAVIRVRDSGIGIGADDLSRVFDLFVQADTTLERTRGGLGLGLTLAKRLVELHDGAIDARSDGPGQGAEFVVRLPVLMDLPAFSPSAQPTSGDAVAAIPRRVLVVDDNHDSAESLALLLQLNGHEVRQAHDGVEAVEAAAAFVPEVVLLDIGLPKLNGYDAARQIRELPRGNRMMLVALTGWGQAADRQRSAEAGFDLHLVKPVNPDALSKLIADLPQAEGR